MKKNLKKLKFMVSAYLVVALVFSFAGGFMISEAQAASLLNKYDTLSTQKKNTVSDHTIVFRTPTGANEATDTITITLPTGFTTNSFDFGDVDFAHSAGSQSNCTAPTWTNQETLAAAPSATAWGAVLSGQVLTLTPPSDGIGAAAIAVNACIQVEIGNHATGGNTQITNHATAGSYSVLIGGNFGDTGNMVINVLDDDQVVVSASVNEVLSFSISDNSVGFGTLSAAAARFASGDTIGSATETAAHNLAVGTNAANGYTVVVSGATLTYGEDTITAIGATNAGSSIGAEQFGVRVMTPSGGSGTATAPYAASGWAFDSAAFPDEIASSASASAQTTFPISYIANIGTETEAGSYTATLTYLASANF